MATLISTIPEFDLHIRKYQIKSTKVHNLVSILYLKLFKSFNYAVKGEHDICEINEAVLM